jgi:pyruvate/2-oxoglutarate dehydrogenase complex dihydrolipoamide dehydrogenase (E3) component
MKAQNDTVLVAPQDTHNEKLVSNVHPQAWRNPAPSGKYNLVVVGAGTAGLISAVGAAAVGAKVALVERHLMGGDCLNVGCVPSKALIRASRAVAEVRDAHEYGVRVPDGVTVDFPAVMERMRRLRAHISRNDSAERYTSLGVDVYLGSARFVAKDALEVDGTRLDFSRAAITTGARAAAPPIPGLEEAGYLTNETLFTLTELPRRLAIIGAGPIGSEMSQSFARFGSEVHLIEMTDRVLPREDRDASRIVEAAFVRDGVNLTKETKLARVESRNGDRVLHLESNGKQSELAVDQILVAIGRAPNVDGLGLEAAGVEYDKRKGVTVNEYLQTTNKRIFAAGDVAFKYKFTHLAEALAGIVVQNALFFRSRKSSALTIPWCTYTEPEVAHVGISEHDAAEQGIEIDTFAHELADVDRGVLDGETDGFVKVHTKKGTDTILGATIVAHHAGEMISEITLAMNGGVGLGTISGVIHPYPTQSEAIKRAGGAYYKTRLTPGIKRLMERWHRWRR